MLRGLYTVATVLEQNTKGIDITSNNLANTQTTGYKRDLAQYEEFNSVLLAKIKGNPPVLQQGTLNVAVETRDETQVLSTNMGYFRIDAPGGVSHNTSVELRAAEDGFLRTVYRNGNREIIENAGYQVLGLNGPIQVGEADFEINAKGEVLVEGNVVDTLILNQPNQMIGTYSGGIKFYRSVSDFEQGNLVGTENNFDFALNDRGFFTISTPQGLRYTRNGQFKIDAEYNLLTPEGHAVIGIDGPIQLTGNTINVNEYGEIIVDGLAVDKLNIVNPKNVENMIKLGGSVFRFDGEMDDLGYQGDVLQGFLENSNVDGLKEMIQMMEFYRAYESAQRVVRSYDDTLSKAVNEVGSL